MGKKQDNNTLKAQHIKPFIRWAGGKQNLVQKLASRIPSQPIKKYYEPFLGAGSLFLYSDFKKSFLSDANPHLINSYTAIRDDPKGVYKRLMYHKSRLNKEYYYQVREKFNKKKEVFDVDQSAMFIFLIHTSYNGIYRVNKKGEYNVPFGKLNPALPGLNHLISIQEKLKDSNIRCCDYQKALKKVSKGDFVYLDPPYPPLNGTSFFQHYTIDKFPEDQQISLADLALSLHERGAFVMISNAETELIKEIYSGWNVEAVSAYRYINCKSIKNVVNELIITNYEFE